MPTTTIGRSPQTGANRPAIGGFFFLDHEERARQREQQDPEDERAFAQREGPAGF